MSGVRFATCLGAALAIVVGCQLASPSASGVLFARPIVPRAPVPSTPLLRAEIASSEQPASTVRLQGVPPAVRAIYLTSWTVTIPSRVQEAIELANATEVNGVVIDVKDYTGMVAFATGNPLIKGLEADVPRVNLAGLVDRFHREGIYVIARIVAFQDQHLLTVRPDLAVRDPQGQVWRDRKGLGWVDPASRETWKYLVEIGRAAARAGVDELNFDYVRFPADGDLSDLRFPVYDPAAASKRQVIRQFFEYLTMQLRPTGVVLSADLFGLATVKLDDLGIGQIIEDALLYFDYVSPMVYPSHYAPGFLQYANPADHPYEVVRYSLLSAEQRRAAFARTLAGIPSGTEPSRPIDRLARLRPWLQAFDLGALYPPPVIRQQIAAVRDVGLTSGWFLWSPSNRYQSAIFELKPVEHTTSR